MNNRDSHTANCVGERFRRWRRFERRRGIAADIEFRRLLLKYHIPRFSRQSDYPEDPQFTVDRALISSYKLTSSSHLAATFNLHITATNPDANYFIYYDIIMVSVYNNSNLLAYNVMPETLVHRPKTKLRLKASPVADDVSSFDGSKLSNTTIVKGVHNSASTMAGVADLEVRIRATTRFDYRGWKKGYHMIKATCYPIMVNLNSSSEASGLQNTECCVFVY